MHKQIIPRSRYDDHSKISSECEIHNEEPTPTQQQFKEECDINVIILKFNKGIMPFQKPPGQYGDFSNVPDYHTALNTTIQAEQSFNSLPAKIRAEFQNDPQKLIKFVSNPKNKQKAIDLGLIPKPLNIVKDDIKETTTVVIPKIKEEKLPT